MNHTEAAQYIKATLTAFGPGEAISMTKETWAKIHEAMQALAQPEQEPVAWTEKVGGLGFKEPMPNANYKVIATIAPQRKPLTDEQIDGIASKFYPRSYGLDEFARAIEAAHGIKE